MTTTHPTIAAAAEVLQEYEAVHSILLFGSRARGEHDAKSDIDICIVEQPNYTVDVREKADMAGSVADDIDLSFFQDLPVHIRMRVLQEGEILYSHDREYLYNLLNRTELEYVQYKHFLDDYHDQVEQRINEVTA